MSNVVNLKSKKVARCRCSPDKNTFDVILDTDKGMVFIKSLQCTECGKNADVNNGFVGVPK